MRQELVGLEGVVAAEVSYDDKLAKIRYLPERVTPQQMVTAIDATGFDASLIEAGSDEGP